MWRELGYGSAKNVFTQTETFTSLLVLGIMGCLVIIRKNLLAFKVVHVVIFIGFLLAGVSSYLFTKGMIGGYSWMLCTGTGLYMSYIPFNSIFFERLIAVFRIRGNTGFLMYFADAFGYLGSVAIMVTKEFMDVNIKWTSFYSNAVIYLTIIGMCGIVVSFHYFKKKYSISEKHSS
jgi:hypothetical protein